METVQQKQQRAKVIEIRSGYTTLQRKVARRAAYGEYRPLIYGAIGGLLLAAGIVILAHFSK